MENNLRDIRKMKKISGYQMANKLEYKSPATYYKKENGIIPFTIKEANIVADYLDVTLDEIFLPNKFPKKILE